jgi:hypothetical protein
MLSYLSLSLPNTTHRSSSVVCLFCAVLIDLCYIPIVPRRLSKHVTCLLLPAVFDSPPPVVCTPPTTMLLRPWLMSQVFGGRSGRCLLLRLLHLRLLCALLLHSCVPLGVVAVMVVVVVVVMDGLRSVLAVVMTCQTSMVALPLMLLGVFRH